VAFIDPFLDERDVFVFDGSNGESYVIPVDKGVCSLENPETCEACE
jgi:hypothetical protein